MKYPYERFLRFLVSRKLDVNQQLEKYSLPRVGPLWVVGCKKNIRNTAPPAMLSYLDGEDYHLVFRDGVLAWAVKEGIDEFWQAQQEFRNAISDELNLAFSVFMNPNARGVLGLLLLSRMTDEERIKLLRERLDVGFDQPTLGLYKSVFWDVNLMGRADWPLFTEELEVDQRNPIVTGWRDSPTIDDVRAMLELGYTYGESHSYENTINYIISTAESEFRTLMKARGMATPDKLAHMARLSAIINENIRTVKSLGKVPGTGAGAESATAEAMASFKDMFSVKIVKSKHISIDELQGHFSSTSEPSKPRGNG